MNIISRHSYNGESLGKIKFTSEILFLTSKLFIMQPPLIVLKMDYLLVFFEPIDQQ